MSQNFSKSKEKFFPFCNSQCNSIACYRLLGHLTCCSKHRISTNHWYWTWCTCLHRPTECTFLWAMWNRHLEFAQYLLQTSIASISLFKKRLLWIWNNFFHAPAGIWTQDLPHWWWAPYPLLNWRSDVQESSKRQCVYAAIPSRSPKGPRAQGPKGIF